MSNPKQIMKEMAMLTVLNNKINPVQEKNLKMFPFIFFDNISECKIEYDLEKVKTVQDESERNNSLISYYLKTSKKVKQKNLEVRFKHLEMAVRELFWKDLRIEVYFNNKIAYKSDKNV